MRASVELVGAAKGDGAPVAGAGSERVDTVRMWAMFVVNVLIVGSVNGFYIYSTLQAYSVDLSILIQYAGESCYVVVELI